jgi:alcohol dehydrogenase class IV
MAANLRALRQRDPVGPALARYAEIARLLTGRPTAAADDGVEWVERQTAALHLVPLRGFGVTRDAFPRVIAQAQQASSMRANPIVLTAAELETILGSAW